MKSPLPLAVMLATLVTPLAESAPLTLTVPDSAAPQREGFLMGTPRRPDGASITLDSQSLRRDGRPWMPVMGEFHYSRYPASEWREELLKMKAGGIDIVATYVFWIHHEEIEGRWDWSGSRDLRRFIELCGEVGLVAAVRCGPWCHGEVRNGGIPDWALAKGWKVRTDDPAYLAHVRVIYGEIAAQLRGLLWKDGGPVMAIQVENEYGGPAEHLVTLKQIAQEAGLDVPLYTRTGWPLLRTPMPFGEIAPLYGAYAEGFWDRVLTSMPGNYWAAFHFSTIRTDAAIANEQLGERQAQDETDGQRYPYLTCELGGGMMSSYHRRIRIDPADIDSVALTKIGSGGNLPGYYMYHGGTNPAGQLSTLEENQATAMTNWNDMPVKGYDFQAPLGEYGQVRPHYHSLRRLHLLARDFGAVLAPMRAALPDLRPANKDDFTTLRWAVRSDGVGGFLFVNNHHRSRPLPAHEAVQFQLQTPAGPLTVPSAPVRVATGARFVWPFRLELAAGVVLDHASAQLVCRIEDADGGVTVFFAEAPGVPAEFVWRAAAADVTAATGTVETARARVRVRGVPPGRDVAVTVRGDGGRTVRVVLLSEEDSLALWKGRWNGEERVLLSRADVVFDGRALRLTATDPGELRASVYPATGDATASTGGVSFGRDGIFRRMTAAAPAESELRVQLEPMQPAGLAREIPLGKSRTPVAAAPTDADFAAAAVWRVRLVGEMTAESDPLLRLHYRGDVARVRVGETFVTDDYYQGRPFEIGLRRHEAALRAANGELQLQVLPLRADAPIFLPEDVRLPAGSEPVAALERVEIVPRYRVELRAR